MVYSLGSFDDFTFEAAVLQRTACTVHVFDPTVLPSEMRRREEVLNGDGPVRVRWHSIGISDEDTDHSSCASSSFSLPPYSRSYAERQCCILDCVIWTAYTCTMSTA